MAAFAKLTIASSFELLILFLNLKHFTESFIKVKTNTSFELLKRLLLKYLHKSKTKSQAVKLYVRGSQSTSPILKITCCEKRFPSNSFIMLAVSDFNRTHVALKSIQSYPAIAPYSQVT